MDLARIFFSLSKFRGISVLWKKAVFSCFPWPHRKKIQRIFIRTILKFDDLPIAHFETDVPLFLKHLWKLGISLKLWVPAHSKVSWSRTMTAKMSVFRPLFWRKLLFWPILTPGAVLITVIFLTHLKMQWHAQEGLASVLHCRCRTRPASFSSSPAHSFAGSLPY